MPRNGSGIYSPPPGTTLTPNTLADATSLESRLADVGSEISASMPLNGVRPMTAPLQVPPGSAAAPGLSFSGDTSSGLAQVSSRTAMVKGGVAGISQSSTDVQAHLPMTASDLTVTGALTAAGGVVGVIHPGVILDYAAATAPTGWLLCYGQAISRTTYAALFAAISTTFGVGDGSTTFNVPDLRGRVAAGKDNMGGVSADRLTAQTAGVDGDTLGAAGGAETHALTSAQGPAHTHTGTTDSAGSHSHTTPHIFLNVSGGAAIIGAAGTPGASIVTSVDGAHTHPFTTASAGSGAAHNNVQPTIVLSKIIKT